MNTNEIFFALCGGVLIGFASILLLVANGKVAGISGMIGGLLDDFPRFFDWRFGFLSGLLVGGLALHWTGHLVFIPMETRSMAALIAAGLLVGIGTQLGSGCTSGHGVCGLGRLSFRSLVATLTFIVAGAVTVFLIRWFAGGSL